MAAIRKVEISNFFGAHKPLIVGNTVHFINQMGSPIFLLENFEGLIHDALPLSALLSHAFFRACRKLCDEPV